MSSLSVQTLRLAFEANSFRMAILGTIIMDTEEPLWIVTERDGITIAMIQDVLPMEALGSSFRQAG